MATSKKDAFKASRLLRDPRTPKPIRSVVASDLAQANPKHGGKK